MCGICGVVALDRGPVTEDELRPMNAAMRLRGPDDEGVWTDGVAGLGHRRLSIIDLAGGHQPMANEDGQVLTVLNGEIYNFLELRPVLEARGHVFRTRSDTEVIVHGYEEWGEGVIERLDGMFALAVWDARQRRLLLARDRFGKKPLCWFLDRAGGRFAFASTITALLRHGRAPRELDEVALARYLALEFVPAPGSILRGVRKLEPGAMLTLDLGRGEAQVRERRYFRLAVGEPGPALHPEEAAARLRGLLVQAVRRRLVADVPVGILLSGGIDSSAVTWAAAEAGARQIRTFSLGFSERSFDETDHARLVARHFGTEHTEDRLSPQELLAVVPRLGEVLDEPMADGSIVPTYCLSRLARRHVTVALGGDGGDELFAGYPMYVAEALARPVAPLLALGGGALVRLAERAARYLPVSHGYMSWEFKLKKTLAGLAYPEEVRNYIWLGAFRPDELPALLGRAVDEAALLAPVAEVYREAPGADALSRVLYQDTRLYLVHHILMKVDRASMANSLEVRAPFLDTALATFVAGRPPREKFARGRGKVLLRRALAGRVPEVVLQRPKKGFGMPIGPWLRGPLRPLAEELLLDRESGLDGLVERPVVSRLLEEHVRGVADHRKRLWTLMVLALWRAAHLK